MVQQEEIGKCSKKEWDASEKRNGRAGGKLVKGGCDELFEESVASTGKNVNLHVNRER